MTADEFWRALPGSREASVHLADFPANTEEFVNEELVGRWSRLMKIRETANAEIEKLRQRKIVGTSLEAQVRLRANGDTLTLLERSRDVLETLFIAQVELQADPALSMAEAGHGDQAGVGEALRLEVRRAQGVRCERCWRYVTSVAAEPMVQGLCERCVEMLAEPVGRTDA